MSFLKNILNPSNKKVGSSYEGGSESLAYNGNSVLVFSPRNARKEKSKGKQSAKTAPIAIESSAKCLEGHSYRRGLGGSAKVITMLGAESLEEAMDIITAMEASNHLNCAIGSPSSYDSEQEFVPRKSDADERLSSSAMKVTVTPSVTSQTCLPGGPKTLHVLSHNTHVVASSDRFHGLTVESNFGSMSSKATCKDEAEIRDYRSIPRTSFVSAVSCEGINGLSESSPQPSPPKRIVNKAHRLPTPPASPVLDKDRLNFPLPRKLPQPYPMPTPSAFDKEIEILGRLQRYHPSKVLNSPRTPTSFLSSPQCPKNWTRGRAIGKGSFGTVYQGLNRDDGSFFAVKISDIDSSSPDLSQEVKFLSRLSHPNIVRYLGSSVEEGRLCIFLELAGMGSLRSILDNYKRFEENMIRIYTRQILMGLSYLHQQNTVHRDIKCANILVATDGQVKLADFGVAKQINPLLSNSCKGTPQYMAPEFSFFFKVSQGELPHIPDHLSAEAKDFIRRCLKLDPKERATVSELLHHPFVSNVSPAIPMNYLQHLAISKHNH
eukprot:TRINITY_DN6770_c0_g2_i2.p1 TRINITY_DN6770_c0_g2~~TRINITY_DN6770_c0_g2_i2.p1  ORF type:complete len:548 (+),score=76.67 TRINITY_DN6770_c0_g2_i2:73-1716(+)